jgi:hypothetical protein
VVHAQVVAAVEEEYGSVAPVQLDEVGAADYVARVAGHGDHKVDDDVFGEEVEEVVAVRVLTQAFLDDAEERVQRPEVFDVLYHRIGSLVRAVSSRNRGLSRRRAAVKRVEHDLSPHADAMPGQHGQFGGD